MPIKNRFVIDSDIAMGLTTQSAAHIALNSLLSAHYLYSIKLISVAPIAITNVMYAVLE